MTRESDRRDRMAEAAQRAADRVRRGIDDPEPSLASRLGQIGVLGWMIVLPILAGLFIGRWLDRIMGTGLTFAAALLMLGAVIGFWIAWRWMHRE